LERGGCREAQNYFDRLIKDYKNHPKVVSGWARAQMDCQKYPPSVYKRLFHLYKKGEADEGVLAALIRFNRHKSDHEKIRDIVSNVDIESLQGSGGSSLLTEWAQYELEKEKAGPAESLLARALQLYPKNAEAHRLLGILYLTQKRDIPKAIASLKSYIYLSHDGEERDRVRALISKIHHAQ
jgi:lipopolysaccharide biosynthesis regulator YciM